MNHPTIQDLRDRLTQSPDEAALALIRQTVEARQQERGEHTEWGLLCEEAGLMGLAFREFQLATRDHPGDETALARLAEHYAERGDADRAAALWMRLLEGNPIHKPWLQALADLAPFVAEPHELREAFQQAVAHGLPAEEAASWLRGTALKTEEDVDAAPPSDNTTGHAFPVPTDADCIRFAALFAGREDVHARQWARPDNAQTGYTPVHEPLTPAVVRNHLLGTFTAGVYPIRLDQTATWFAVDLDIRRPALDQARRDAAYAGRLREMTRHRGLDMLGSLERLGFEPLFENSGYKGRHYWVFLEEPEEAKVLHQFGRLLLFHLQQDLEQEFSLEFFPKQAKRSGKGLGNLIKLPLGIHRKTGYRSLLLDRDGNPFEQPLERLKEVRRLSRERLYKCIDRLKEETRSLPPSSSAPPREMPEQEHEGAESMTKDVAGPAPPDVAPLWTEADFEADPRMRHLLRECPVLAELKSQVDKHRRLSHDEQIVLIHTLGHVAGGPQAVNYLLQQCVDVPTDALMQSRLKGNPISCPKIRKRIGHLTRRVKCRCVFPFAPNHYPTPVLHLETLPEESAPVRPPSETDRADPQTLARRFGVLDRQRREIERQWRQMHDALCQMLHGRPDRALSFEDGRYELVVQDGIETLAWKSHDSDASEKPGTETSKQSVPDAGEDA